MAPIFPLTTMLVVARAMSSRSWGSIFQHKRNEEDDDKDKAPKMPTNLLGSPQTRDLRPGSDREHLLIMIIAGTAVLSFVALLAYFIHRRFAMISRRRLQEDLEDGKKEVTEARAFRSQDDTLKEGYYTPFAAEDGSIFVRTPVLQTPAAAHRSEYAPSTLLTRISIGGTAPGFEVPSVEVPSVEAHPLFRPGIKRSRTAPTKKAPQYSNRAMRGPISYPNLYDEDQSIRSQPSSISLGSYYSAESKAMNPFSTMQTRRPETPPTELETTRQSAPAPIGRRQIHSFMSVSDSASMVPSSPSIYSPTSPRPRELSPRPAPLPFASGQVLCEDPYRPRSGKPVGPVPTPIRPMFPIDRDGTLPVMSYPLPLLLRKSASSLPRIHLPQSPPLSPRTVPPSAPPCTSPFGQVDELPKTKIERWLSGSGSTGTASIIESVLGSRRRSSQPDIYGMEHYGRTDRVHSIRSMRSSRRSSTSSSRSGEDLEEIIVGAVF